MRIVANYAELNGSLKPQNLIIHGDIIFADMIKVRISRGNVLGLGWVESETERRPGEEKGIDEKDVPIPRAAGSYQKLGDNCEVNPGDT